VGPTSQQEEAPRTEHTNQGGKHISEKTPMARKLDGLAEQSSGLQGRNGLAWWTGPVGPDPREKSNGNLILNFN
jgi:hypothetical protein